VFFSVEIKFLNCTRSAASGISKADTECSLNSAVSLDTISQIEDRDVGMLAKSDSLNLPSDIVDVNNVYSGAITVEAFGGLHSGFLTCLACSKNYGCSEAVTPFFITDLPSSQKNGTFIEGSAKSVVEGEAVNLTCAASKYKFSSVSWRLQPQQQSVASSSFTNETFIENWNTEHSRWSRIWINKAAMDIHSRTFKCHLQRSVSEHMTLST
jgi:hypothetical protein